MNVQERDRAGVTEGRGCRGSGRGRGFSRAWSAGEPVSGNSRSGEESRSARMGAGAVPGSGGLLTDTPGMEAPAAAAGST